MKLDLSYLGWSGCQLEAGGAPDLQPVLFDPPPRPPSLGLPFVVMVTHGHPEHVQGALRLVRRRARPPITVIGSRSVCRFLEGRSRNSDDAFHVVGPGDQTEVGGWRVHVFEWDHMTLLPSGWRTKGRYLAMLATHPLRLARIGLSGIAGPRHRPMLGFRVEASKGGPAVAYFGEGLHRRTTVERLQAGLGALPVGALIAGVEPEDAIEIPNLLGSRPIGGLIAFEPHRVWREQFGMPQIDLPDLRRRLGERGVMSWTPAPGETVRLP